MVEWENHRYFEDWENSLITKNFAFQFVNGYIALFAAAFYFRDGYKSEGDAFGYTFYSLGVILVGKQIIVNLIDYLLPKLQVGKKRTKLNELWTAKGKDIANLSKEDQLHKDVEE